MTNSEELRKALVELDIPEHMHGAVIRYIEKGIPPGSFLTAVIENDLKNAVGYADEKNVRKLPEYIKLFYNYAPSGCWGSPGDVSRWVKQMQSTATGEKVESILG